jgi:hypothetical protein
VNLTWGQFLSLAAASGAAAGLANQLFRFGHDWIADRRTKEGQRRELDHQRALQDRELAHQRDLQSEEREHQAQLRREEAFFAAREELLGEAVAVFDWAQWWWGDLYGAEVDYHPISLNRPELHEAADAMEPDPVLRTRRVC